MYKYLLSLGIAIGLGISFFLLYNRRKKWNTNKLRLIITLPLLSISLYGLWINSATNVDNAMFDCYLAVPFINSAFDRLFKWISFRIQIRDFYLWLRYSDDINNYGLSGKNPHVKSSDIIISIALLVIIIFSLIAPVLLFGN